MAGILAVAVGLWAACAPNVVTGRAPAKTHADLSRRARGGEIQRLSDLIASVQKGLRDRFGISKL